MRGFEPLFSAPQTAAGIEELRNVSFLELADGERYSSLWRRMLLRQIAPQTIRYPGLVKLSKQ
jgi:hypothetical protein